MQGYSTPSLLYDDGFFGRSELNFNDNGPGGEPTISSGLLGLSDSLDRLDTASSFSSGSLQQAMGDASLGPTAQSDSMTGQPVGNKNVSHDSHSNQHRSHNQRGPDHGNPFGVHDSSGNMVNMQDILHPNQLMNGSSISNNNVSHGHGSMIDHINMEGAGERSSQVESGSNGVTSQWEESLQDLQSLLALHGQQHSQIVNIGLPMTPDHGTAFANGNSIRVSGGYGFEKGRDAGSSTGGFPNSNFPAAAAADSELLSLLHFPRLGNSSPSLQQPQQILQAPAGPVSAYPSNPGFRKGSGGPVNSSSNTLIQSAAGGLYTSPGLPQNSSSFPYSAPSLVGSNYFNMNPSGSLGNLNSFMNHANVPLIQKQRMRAPSIIDLEQARDHCSEDNMNGLGGASSAVAAAKFSSLFDAKRSGSEGSLLLSGKGGSEPRGINHFATERQRREYLNEKYQTLRSLVPNPSKADRASIVADAIEYVKELKRTVQELQILVQDKRKETSLKEAGAQYCSGSKRRRDTDDSNAESQGGGPGADISSPLRRSFSFNDGKSSTSDPLSDVCHLRNSWLQRTSQSTGTHVDVRIVHDEVTIKVTQRRRKQGGQMLLHAMVTLYELHLDLQHANGAIIGEHDVYIFNTKVFTLNTSKGEIDGGMELLLQIILEGSSTFAGYVVTKFLEAVDRDYPPKSL